MKHDALSTFARNFMAGVGIVLGYSVGSYVWNNREDIATKAKVAGQKLGNKVKGVFKK